MLCRVPSCVGRWRNRDYLMRRRRRRLGWIITSVLVVLIALAWVGWQYISPRQIGQDGLEGMTKAQIRAKYGAPNHDDGDLWIYYRGRGEGGTGISFKDGVATHVEMRDAR